MDTRKLLSGVLGGVGLLAMLGGAIDPLEGCGVVLLGTALAAAGAVLGHSRYRRLLGGALALVVIGVGAMVIFTMLGGIGGRSGHSPWWGLLAAPYPIGWLLGIVGDILRLWEIFRHPTPSPVA